MSITGVSEAFAGSSSVSRIDPAMDLYEAIFEMDAVARREHALPRVIYGKLASGLLKFNEGLRCRQGKPDQRNDVLAVCETLNNLGQRLGYGAHACPTRFSGQKVIEAAFANLGQGNVVDDEITGGLLSLMVSAGIPFKTCPRNTLL